MTRNENPYAYVSYEAPQVSDRPEDTGLRSASKNAWKQRYPDVHNVQGITHGRIQLIFLVNAESLEALEEQLTAMHQDVGLPVLDVSRHNLGAPAASLPQEVAS